MEKCGSGSNLRPILSIVPFHGCCLVLGRNVNIFKPSETLVVRGKDYPIFARLFNTNAVIGKRVGGVEVEYEQQPSTFEDNDLVSLILEGHVSLRSGKPSVFLFGVVHRRVEPVEVLVTKKFVISNVPLSPRVVE